MSRKNPARSVDQMSSVQSFGTVTPLSSSNATFRNQEENDLHLHLESFDDYGDFDDEEDEDDDEYQDYSFSDGDYESDVTLEEAEGGGLDLPRAQRSERKGRIAAQQKSGTEGGVCSDLVPVDQDAADPYAVNSDEENELLKGIKDEIKDMVRAEMQSELAVYENRVKAIEAGRLPSAAERKDEPDKYPDLANMEPELREAYIKMWKLDRILAKRVKKEKEVKRDRILLERRIRDEISSIQPGGRVQRDIKANTEKYLSLTLPPSHNEGVIVDEPSVTPVFQTQVDEQDLQGRADRRAASSSNKRRSSGAESRESREASAASSRTDGTESTQGRDSTTGHGRRRKRKKDFIKRNKELAANANEMVVMTDDEKKRLQDLLTDLDALPDIPEEGVNSDLNGDNNPFQVVVHPGEGFLPSDTEWRALSSIDQRLQSIMPEEDFRSIASSSLSSVPQQRLFTRVGVRSNLDCDYETYGERALIETKEEREVQTKLKEIEERLSRFTNHEEEKAETPALTQEQLDSLLDDCVRSMSRISAPPDTPHSIDTDRTLESARAQMMLNPPRLSDETLQKLLSEAHFPLSTQLLALQDDDSKSAHSGEEGGAIRAETWKAIADEKLSDEDISQSVSDSNMQTRLTSERMSHPDVRPSWSDGNFHPSRPRQAYLHRSGSDSDGRDSRISLPEISSSPFLINTLQGQGTSSTGSMNGAANNDPTSYRGGVQNAVRVNSSLDNMIHNDLSANALRNSSSMSSGAQRLSGTPLMVEDVGGDQGQTTPIPHPPASSSERQASGATAFSRASMSRDART